jgi:hypothetical protein
MDKTDQLERIAKASERTCRRVAIMNLVLMAWAFWKIVEAIDSALRGSQQRERQQRVRTPGP